MNDILGVIIALINGDEIDRDSVIYHSEVFSLETVWDLAQGEANAEYVLYEICDRIHSGCDFSCPVFQLMTVKERNNINSGCRCFKNGKAMKLFILDRYRKETK